MSKMVSNKIINKIIDTIIDGIEICDVCDNCSENACITLENYDETVKKLKKVLDEEDLK